MVAKHELLSSFYITATYLLMKNKLVSEAWTHIIVPIVLQQLQGFCTCADFNETWTPIIVLLIKLYKSKTPLIANLRNYCEMRGFASNNFITFVANVHEPPTVVLRITATICKVWKRSHTWAFYHRSTYFTATLMRIRKRIIGITKRTCSDIIEHIPSCPNIITTLWKVKYNKAFATAYTTRHRRLKNDPLSDMWQTFTWTLIIISK